MSEPCAKQKRTTQSSDDREDHVAGVKKQRLGEDSTGDNIQRQHVQDQKAITEGGPTSGASNTLTALSAHLPQRHSQAAEDGDSSDSESDESAPTGQPPANLQEIGRTDKHTLAVDDASSLLNHAEELLEKGQYPLAYAEAKRAVGNGDKERALRILGDAAYGMRQWELAEGHYQELCDAFPSNDVAKERLHRAQSRQAESLTGIYDIAKLYELGENGETDIDVADFLGPIEVVDVPGKGKGLVATQDVRKGTLLMVSKAFATVDASSTEAIAQAVADKLQLRPEMAAEINALYDGNDRVPGAPVDQGLELYILGPKVSIPDIERLTRVCKYGFGIDDDRRGLWILPSYFNNSCLSNAFCTVYGDVATFFAVSDIKKGGEITIRCIGDVFARYKQREDVYREMLGFTCSCRLCKLDRADPRYEERQQLIGQALHEHSFISFMFSPSRATGVLTPLLKQLRATYGNRQELRSQMCEPLRTLAMDYLMTGRKDRYDKALKLFIEIPQYLDESLLSGPLLPFPFTKVHVFRSWTEASISVSC